jgi:hypothetical protein
MTDENTIYEPMTDETNGQPRINKRLRKDDDDDEDEDKDGKPSKSQDIMIIPSIEAKLNEIYQLYKTIPIIETDIKTDKNHDIIDKMAQEVRDIFSYDEFVKNFNNSASVSEYIYVKSMLLSAGEITNDDELYNKLYTLYIFLNENNILLLKNLLTNINLIKIKNIQENFNHIKIEQLEQLKELVELTGNIISEHMHPELDYECLSDIDN